MSDTQENTHVGLKLQVLVLSEALQKIVEVGHEGSEWAKADMKRIAAKALTDAGIPTG